MLQVVRWQCWQSGGDGDGVESVIEGIVGVMVMATVEALVKPGDGGGGRMKRW